VLEIEAFNAFLSALYREEFKVESWELAESVARVADHYGEIPAVRCALQSNMLHPDWALDTTDAVPVLRLACQLRSSVLFRDAFIHTVGKWGSQNLQSQKSLLPNEMHILADRHYIRLREKVISATQGLLYICSKAGTNQPHLKAVRSVVACMYGGQRIYDPRISPLPISTEYEFFIQVPAIPLNPKY
jgi:hypothetical protein